ncbi:MAG: CRTAC1 family protein, partial [Chitinophagaceae bacterium]
LYVNNQNGRFLETANYSGVAASDWSWGALFFDIDNDGDLDLVVNNENEPAFVYRNNSREQNGNSYIGVVLKGAGQNRWAIGSKIRVYKDGQVFYRELVPSRGFQSSVDYKQIIGLGGLKEVDSMVIDWPDRSCSRYVKPELNRVHVVEQGVGAGAAGGPGACNTAGGNGSAGIGGIGGSNGMGGMGANTTLLTPVTSTLLRHQEDNYIDFYYERNLPELLSAEGPKVAHGDVNADGLEDIYIGGAKGQEGQLYLQTDNGFKRQEQEVFKRYAGFEDVAVLFFDADKDGDLDLFIGAGGNNAEPRSMELQHRLYVNDGKGNFTIDVRAFQGNDMNIAVAVNYDYDGDGDEDLFVGSRSIPYNYGINPTSYIYNNDGRGHFTEVTRQVAPELTTIGMVTGAVWADVTGTAEKELIVTGEWMSPRIWSYDKSSKRFTEQKNTGLEGLSGWWQSIAVADLNGDGKQDLVLGNVGENFYLRPDEQHPVKLWLNDFDNNGSTEQFLTRTVDGKDMPVFLKRE